VSFSFKAIGLRLVVMCKSTCGRYAVISYIEICDNVRLEVTVTTLVSLDLCVKMPWVLKECELTMLYWIHEKKSVVYFHMLLSNRVTKLCWFIQCHTLCAQGLLILYIKKFFIELFSLSPFFFWGGGGGWIHELFSDWLKFLMYQHLQTTQVMFDIDQLDVTIFIPLFTLYMFRTILVHHQEICYVWHAGLTL
jgi:hypothetical protein